jgi:hypothetical protein
MRINEFSKQYVGYCSHGILVTGLIEIISSSQIRTNSKTLDGGMHLNMIVLVEGILYERNELIPDAKILKITDTTAVASSKYASIVINIGRVSILKIGDTTPVIVRLSQYNKLTDKIAVAANLFIPTQPKLCMLELSGEYKEDLEIANLFKKINNCKKLMSELPNDAKKSISYFNDLIFAYAKPKKWNDKFNLLDINGEKKEIQLTDIAIDKFHNEFKDAKLCILLPKTKYLDDKIYKVNKLTEFGVGIWKLDNYTMTTMQMTKMDAYKKLLAIYYQNMYTLLQFGEAYPDKTAISKSSHIWKFYEMNRIN